MVCRSQRENGNGAILKELIPEVENNLRTCDSRKADSLRLVDGRLRRHAFCASLYPEMFSAAALLSPAIYDPGPPRNSALRRVGMFRCARFRYEHLADLNYPALWDAYSPRKRRCRCTLTQATTMNFMIEARSDGVLFAAAQESNSRRSCASSMAPTTGPCGRAPSAMR